MRGAKGDLPDQKGRLGVCVERCYQCWRAGSRDRSEEAAGRLRVPVCFDLERSISPPARQSQGRRRVNTRLRLYPGLIAFDPYPSGGPGLTRRGFGEKQTSSCNFS